MSQAIRSLLGLLAAILVLSILALPFELGLVVEPNWLARGIVDDAAKFFLAAAVGAFVARGAFVLPAVLFVVTLWAIVVYIAYLIALPAGPASLLDIAFSNAAALFTYIVAAVLGAIVGEGIHGRHLKPTSSAS